MYFVSDDKNKGDQSINRNIPKVFQIAPCVKYFLFWKLHENPFNRFYTPVWKTDVLCRGNVRPSACPSVRPSAFSGLFFNMLWDINLKLGIYIQ